MQLRKGTVVRSKAGHDKGRFFVVLGMEQNVVLLSDGKDRNAEHPKKKNKLHIAPTNTVLEEQTMNEDSKISEALDRFYQRVRAT